MLGLASEMPKIQCSLDLTYFGKRRLAFHTALRPKSVSETTAVAPSGMLAVFSLAKYNGALVLISAVTFDSSPFPVAKLSLYSAVSSGENSASVWQMGEHIFFL